MKSFLILIPVFVCLIYTQTEKKAMGYYSGEADLTQFMESADEFLEHYGSECLEIEVFLVNLNEFLEDCYPVPPPREPSLIQNHNTEISLLMSQFTEQ